jgi:hypothetical protein
MRASIGRPGHFRRFLATAITGLGGALAMAPAASADHFAGVNSPLGGSCFTQAFGGWAAYSFSTDDWRLTFHESGKVRLVCRFASLPSSWETVFGDRLELPRKLTDPMGCYYDWPDSGTLGEFRILPNGSGTLRCTWPAPTN